MEKSFGKKIVSVALIAALCLSALLTIFAAPAEIYRGAAADKSLRFKQVVLGKDFAIALTYGGDLYGWDTEEKGTGVNALGIKYGTSPKKIKVDFVKGPTYTSSVVNDTTTPDTTDEIVKIAATYSSAAFITKHNNIYTWGTNSLANANRGILLRTLDAGVTSDPTPTIVDYEADGTVRAMVPRSPYGIESTPAYNTVIPAEDNSLLDIVGSDSNYVIKHKRSGGLYFYGWGSSRYMTTKAATEISGDSGDYVTEEIYNFHTVSDTASADMSIGGGTLLIAANNSIYVRGKNYYIPNKDSDYVYNVGHSRKLSETSDSSLKHIIYLENILDLYSSNADENDGVEFTVAEADLEAGFNDGLSVGGTHKYPFTWTNELLYLASTHGSRSRVYAVNEAFASGKLDNTNFPYEFYQAKSGASASALTGSVISSLSEFYDNSSSSASVSVASGALSMGNGYGYFILPGSGSGADNVLYFFGNGYNGQSGTSDKKHYGAITAITPAAGGFSGSPVSIAAGKTTMGTPMFDSLTADGSFHGGALGLDFVSGSYEQVTANATQLKTVADGKEFISGMITDDSGTKKVYVWNGDKTITDLTTQFAALGIDGSAQKSITALSSGYGNCLVALSSQGKIYQISYESGDFSVKLKDSFVDESGAATQNFTVNNGNRIAFASSNGRPKNDKETQSEAKYTTFTLASLTDSSADEELTDGSVFNNVIASNNSGDAFRILMPEDVDLRSRYVVSDKLVGTDLQIPENGKPKFYFKDDKTPIPDEILTHYLKYEMTSDINGVVSVKIVPFQSTKGRAIVMEYYIGRFGNLADGKISVDDSTYRFYDIAAVTTEITIANTVAQFNSFNNRLEGNTANNITVPVLDPNNTENNMYSIAVTNSQYGLAKLADYFKVTDKSAFNNYVIAQITAQDKGFPAVSKIAKGNLNRYYAGGDDINYQVGSYFNDIYQYFAFDPDGDSLGFEASGIIERNSANSYFGTRTRTIEFDIPIAQYFGSELNADSLPHFNNIYGLGLEIREDSLHVSYRVVQFTALKSTGKVTYNGDDIGKAETKGIKSGDGSYSLANIEGYQVSITETYRNEAGATAINYSLRSLNAQERETHAVVPLYAQSSMVSTIKEDPDDPDSGYYRAEEGHNVYTYSTVRRIVGGSDNSNVFRYKLSEQNLFSDTNKIYLTYETVTKSGDTTEVNYKNYANFIDQYDKSLTRVSLNEQEFVFESFVPEKYTAIFTVRRFSDEQMTKPVKGAGGVDEVMTLVFNIEYSAPTLSVNTASVNGTVINADKTYSIDAFTSAKDAVFTDVKSSNPKTASVQLDSNGKNFTVTPVSSGSVNISFTVKQYQATANGNFTLSVESRCIMNERISLYDSEKIYLSEMKLAIAQQYSGDDAFDASKYGLDTVTDRTYAPNGYYFVTRNNSEEPWQKVLPANWPSFIGKVEVLKAEDRVTDESIELTLGNYTDVANFGEYMLVAKFISNDTNPRKFEAAVIVEPQKIFLLDGDSESGILTVTVQVNKGNVVLTEGKPWETDKENKHLILRLSNLLADTGISATDSNLQVVRAASSSSFEFFDIAKEGNKSISIKPTRNTKEPQLVNASISVGSARRVISFYVEVTGIVETLDGQTYITVWLSCAAVVFLILFIVFMVRMGIYWKKKAEQRKIIRKNQMLIKMRDKVHGKSDAVTKEQLVQTKLKLEDPKYAKMFNEMKKAAVVEQSDGISVEDVSDSSKKSKKKNKGGKKNGKKSLDELKAELAAKKEAFAKMQMGDEVQMPVTDIPVEPDFGSFGVIPDEVVPDSPLNDKINSDDNILFDVETLDDNN